MLRSLRCSYCQTFHGYVRTFSNGQSKTQNQKISKYRFKQLKQNNVRGKSIGATDVALLLFPAATFGLGVWQTKRLYWKLNLIEELTGKSSAPAVDLPYELSDIECLEYKKVRVRGRFDHSREQYIGPRSFLNDGVEIESHGLIGSPDRVGWHVITPFCLEGCERDGDTILVNRGWVQNQFLNPSTREEGQIEETHELVGAIRKTEQRQQFAAKHLGGNKWQYRDIQALASQLGTKPIFLDADVHSTVPGGPIGGQTRVSLRNDHFTYLLTWYTLSAATLFMWCKRILVR